MFQCARWRRTGADHFESIADIMNLEHHIESLHQLSPLGEGDIGGMLHDVSLPPFLRALLVADGTVTVLLRAYFEERIDVRARSQSTVMLKTSIPALRLEAGDEAFQRQVDLTGASTSAAYASAISILNPAALPDELFSALIQENVGMGEVLRNSARGSYREVLDIRIEGAKVERTYLVYLDGRPAILITEDFNSAVF